MRTTGTCNNEDCCANKKQRIAFCVFPNKKREQWKHAKLANKILSSAWQTCDIHKAAMPAYFAGSPKKSTCLKQYEHLCLAASQVHFSVYPRKLETVQPYIIECKDEASCIMAACLNVLQNRKQCHLQTFIQSIKQCSRSFQLWQSPVVDPEQLL